MEVFESDQLNKIATKLREDSVGWKNAKAEFDGISEIKVHDLATATKAYGSNSEIVKRSYEALVTKTGAGVIALSGDRFLTDYDLRCALSEKAKFGAVDCIELSFAVDWPVREVHVNLYTGEAKNVVIDDDIMTSVNEGRVRNFRRFAESSGLTFHELRSARVEQTQNLLRVFQTGMACQNKLTILVKGCLIFLNLLEQGGKECAYFFAMTLKDDVDGLNNAMNFADSAFVFSTDGHAHGYNCFLFGMCEEYPHHTLGGASHVSILADATNIFLVSYNVAELAVKVLVTPEIARSALIRYANQFNLENQLEQALAIACSLRENKYLDKVGLPALSSNVDLVYPALVKTGDGVLEITWVNTVTARCLGRIHQMLCLALLKNVDLCVTNTSREKLGIERTLKSFLSRDGYLMLSYMDEKGATDPLKLTSDMRWLNYLDDKSIHRLRGVSIFEGLWLIDYPKKVLQDGGIKCMKKGRKNPIGIMPVGLYVDSFSTLLSEVHKGGHGKSFTIPDGDFNVRFSCITEELERKAREMKFSYKGKKEEPSAKPGVGMVCSRDGELREGPDDSWEFESDEERNTEEMMEEN